MFGRERGNTTYVSGVEMKEKETTDAVKATALNEEALKAIVDDYIAGTGDASGGQVVEREALLDLMEEYLRNVRKKKHSTVKEYRRQINVFFAWCDSRGFNPIVISDEEQIMLLIEDFRNHCLYVKSYSVKTTGQYTCTIRHFYKALIDRHILEIQVDALRDHHHYYKREEPLLDQFEKYLEPEYCQDTRLTAVCAANSFITWCKDQGIDWTSASTAAVKEFRKHIKGKHTRSTAGLYMGFVLKFIEMAITLGVYTGDFDSTVFAPGKRVGRYTNAVTVREKVEVCFRLVTSDAKDTLVNALVRVLTKNVASGEPSEKTVMSHLENIEQYVQWCVERNIDLLSVTEEIAEDYRDYLKHEAGPKGDGLARSTVGTRLSSLRVFYKGLWKQKRIDENPFLDVYAPHNKVNPQDKIKVLTKDETQKLLDVLPRDNSIQSKRDRALIAIMITNGFRRGEMAGASAGGLTCENGNHELVVEGKGSIHTVALRPDAAMLLKSYLDEREVAGEVFNKESPLFSRALSNAHNQLGHRLCDSSVSRIVTAYLKSAGLKNIRGRIITTHGLRHTAITNAIDATGDIAGVGAMVDHKRSETTLQYFHRQNIHQRNPANFVDLVLDPDLTPLGGNEEHAASVKFNNFIKEYGPVLDKEDRDLLDYLRKKYMRRSMEKHDCEQSAGYDPVRNG